jgi:hypothetical protein
MSALKLQCCLCGKGIGDNLEVAHRLDPCALVLVANWDKELPEPKEQQFFCHFACFKRVVEPHAPLHIEDADTQ